MARCLLRIHGTGDIKGLEWFIRRAYIDDNLSGLENFNKNYVIEEQKKLEPLYLPPFEDYKEKEVVANQKKLKALNIKELIKKEIE